MRPSRSAGRTEGLIDIDSLAYPDDLPISPNNKSIKNTVPLANCTGVTRTWCAER